ncbi:zinc finger X-chromosomal protein-like [Rhodnius prolixus]|uniref:zinc finger X-chromosomal protein-like n=1 Tax=Rhodnius prolixus TaxID=13249 RepID=UPI003D1887CA
MCNGCGKTFAHMTSLKFHLRHHCGVEPQFQCPECPYKAKRRTHLKTHMANKHFDVIKCNMYKDGLKGEETLNYLVSGNRYKEKRKIPLSRMQICFHEKIPPG